MEEDNIPLPSDAAKAAEAGNLWHWRHCFRVIQAAPHTLFGATDRMRRSWQRRRIHISGARRHGCRDDAGTGYVLPLPARHDVRSSHGTDNRDSVESLARHDCHCHMAIPKISYTRRCPQAAHWQTPQVRAVHWHWKFKFNSLPLCGGSPPLAASESQSDFESEAGDGRPPSCH